MKLRTLVYLLFALGLLFSVPVLLAQEDTDDSAVPAPVEQTDQEMIQPAVEEILTYDDYTIKA